MVVVKKSTVAFLLLSVIASALSYVTYPILSRILSAEQYTDITVSLSLLTQVTTFLSSIIAITIGISKSSDHRAASKDIDKLQAMLFRLFAVLSLIFLAISPIIMPIINTPVAYAVSICIAMFASIPLAMISGYLNGKNMLTKVGLAALLVAALQVLAGVSTALLTHSGVWTMTLMGVAQLIAVILLYRLFSQDHIPHIRGAVSKVHFTSPAVRKLATYTFFASIAIMAINLLQIADLLIIERLTGADIKLYTDIYIVSRVVFFAGMIFIWPFLGQISLSDHTHNIKILLKLMALFCLISAVSIIGMYLFGETIVKILFDSNYGKEELFITSALSIVYKFLLLIITAISLYMVVLRRYAAVFLALAATSAVFFIAITTDSSSSINITLAILDTATAVITVLALIYAALNKSIEKN